LKFVNIEYTIYPITLKAAWQPDINQIKITLVNLFEPVILSFQI
jgi:hypothetical protein